MGLRILKILLIFGHGVNRPRDLDCCISKWSRWSPVSWVSFMPILSFPRPSVLDLRQVQDRQTDRQRPSLHYAPTYGGGA